MARVQAGVLAKGRLTCPLKGLGQSPDCLPTSGGGAQVRGNLGELRNVCAKVPMHMLHPLRVQPVPGWVLTQIAVSESHGPQGVSTAGS